MSVELEGDIIFLRGNCLVEDAEPLLILVQNHPHRRVDIGGASNLHTAVLQVLLAFRPELTGPCRDLFLQEWIVPLVTPDHDIRAFPDDTNNSYI